MNHDPNMPDMPSREQLNRKIAGGRYALLLILLLTALNLALLVFGNGNFFLFSASVPYYLTLLALGLDNGFSPLSWNVIGTGTRVALAVSCAILALYLACLLLSKKRPGWLWGALVLFLLDSAALVWISFVLLSNPLGNLMDGFLHLWALTELVQAVRANRLRKNLEAME